MWTILYSAGLLVTTAAMLDIRTSLSPSHRSGLVLHLPPPRFHYDLSVRRSLELSAGRPLNPHHVLSISDDGMLVFNSSLPSSPGMSYITEARLVDGGQMTELRVRVDILSEEKLCTPGFQLCFPVQSLRLDVLEDTPESSNLFFLRPPGIISLCHGLVPPLYAASGGPVEVDPDLGHLILTSALDYEVKEQRSSRFEVLCRLGGKTYNLQGTLTVLDVDDNPPVPESNTTKSLETSKLEGPHGRPLQLIVFDADSVQVNRILVKIAGDSLELFSVARTGMYPDVRNGSMLFYADIAPKEKLIFPGLSYNFSVIFEDSDFVPKLAEESNQVEYQIQVWNLSSSSVLPPSGEILKSTLSRHAALFARVHLPIRPSPGLTFSVRSPFLAVSPSTGTLFVRNDTRLRSFPAASCDVNVSYVGESRGWYLVRLEISPRLPLRTSVPQRPCGSCAVHGSRAACRGQCGLGTPTGQCQWREQADGGSLSSQFATCLSDPATCLDGRCDETEQRHVEVCPQDCAREIRGEARSRGGRGIEIAVGPCVCRLPQLCHCSRPLPPSPSRSLARGDNGTTVEATAIRTDGPRWSCRGRSCLPLALTVLLAITALACVLVACRHGRRKPASSRLVVSRATTPPAVEPATWMAEDDVAGWEFPRDHLQLERELGAGEFGRVVRAKARGLVAGQEYTVVAVKMLKGGSSSAEQQDLLSEFRLLKEICHQNVIRLLGVCSHKDGPLYLVMEYAEHGSLLSVLRGCRTADNPAYLGLTSVRLGLKQLLAFAWQIARGMSYLSDMKVVHRDLAARNVLVAEGMVAKISDFGMSRDIYEGDAYLRRSRGRVPVKWMALESLEAHLYTTKSDVWSFGVVLWEIMTLGATPYPGVSPERMFQLLKLGYRMERPAGCPDEIYQTMVQCWRESLHDRPSFKDLVHRLDLWLQDTTEYVALENTPVRDNPETYGKIEAMSNTPLLEDDIQMS